MAELSQIYKGTTDIFVLAVLDRGQSYGYEILREIKAAGAEQLSDASIYGTLKRLEGQGMLSSHLVASESGPARRYYRITASGKERFAMSLEAWGEVAKAMAKLTRRDRK